MSLRPDLQKLIPKTARRILDIGCGIGELGQALKARQECEVIGVEIDSRLEVKALEVLDDVVGGDVEELSLQPWGKFDYIVLGDVLEHLRDPGVVLTRLMKSLTSDGCFVISIPNVRHWSVLRDLLQGQWEYKTQGLLDRGHLRFFTRKSFERLLRRVGLQFQLVHVNRINFPTVPDSVTEALSNSGMDVSTLEEESQAYQYLYVAKPVEVSRVPGLISIIILCHNLWKQTQACLESIEDCTQAPYEVIVIDNGSMDETSRELEKLKTSRPWLTVVRNDKNETFSVGNNQGIDVARGEFILLLNNDTVVTDGWLTRMLSAFQRFPSVGIVGPMSNYVAGVQKIEDVSYKTMDEMATFAKEWGSAHSSETIPVMGVIGFCLLVRKEVLDVIGTLDEQFVNGFEETDFCFRATRVGYECLVAKDVFIHHTGSQTFWETETEDSYWQGIRDNWERFREKWDIPVGMDANAGLAWLIRPKGEHDTVHPRVYWATLFERAIMWEGVDALLDVSAAAGKLGYTRIAVPYSSTDVVRNHLVRAFLSVSRHPNDTLVMLDCDHLHPPDILERLACRDEGVVAALAFRRGPPYEPLFWTRDKTGDLQQFADYEPKTYVGEIVGTGAIAIKRWVFSKLKENGNNWPYFRCEYPEGTVNRPGEEMYFAKICELSGIRHHCDTSLEIPHLTTTVITSETWKAFRNRHPEVIKEPEHSIEEASK